jgi:uncharacterized protein
MTPQTCSFPSGDIVCDAWFFAGDEAIPASPAGRAAVVMAHGFGGTKDSGLAAFATALAATGAHVLAFDYRGFGTSGGQPRQVVSLPDQLADYRAAMLAAKRLPGADPNRLVLWGESLSGGTVLAAAAGRDDVAAVISLVPLVDGLAAARHAVRTCSPASLGRSGTFAAAGALARLAGRPPVLMPLVAGPGRPGALTVPGFLADYLAIAGPSWRNEVSATIAVDIARFRPGRQARQLRSPWLVQIADFDRAAPADSAARAAVKGRAVVRRYPCDHFDVQPGKPWHAQAVAHQVAFLHRSTAV